ncbi:MAG: hypothetical protein U1E52_03905 [Geminicoccaceae bacterium]
MVGSTASGGRSLGQQSCVANGLTGAARPFDDAPSIGLAATVVAAHFPLWWLAAV